MTRKIGFQRRDVERERSWMGELELESGRLDDHVEQVEQNPSSSSSLRCVRTLHIQDTDFLPTMPHSLCHKMISLTPLFIQQKMEVGLRAG